MTELSIIAQIIIAAGIVNVWILRFGKATPYRPEGATNMVEEFRRYGLPDWARRLTGIAKLALAALLVVGIWEPRVAAIGAIGMAVLMAGALAAHARVSDPPLKSVPALTMLALSLIVVVTHGV